VHDARLSLSPVLCAAGAVRQARRHAALTVTGLLAATLLLLALTVIAPGGKGETTFVAILAGVRVIVVITLARVARELDCPIRGVATAALLLPGAELPALAWLLARGRRRAEALPAAGPKPR
jgi:hypothetical protein